MKLHETRSAQAPANIRLTWRYLAFDQLSTADLYAVLQLRSEVFVVEQTCAFQDMDNADQEAMHLLGTCEPQGRAASDTAQTALGGAPASPLLAYARCLPAGLKFTEASIGRVITSQALRGQGAGHSLMREAISRLQQSWGVQAIRIGAQSRLQDFYRQHGFEPQGQVYLEDGIAHVEMLRP